MKCVSDSFDSPSQSQPDFLRDDNKYLKEEAEKWKALGSAYWPSVVVNDRTYRGDLVPDNVMNAICSSFSEEPGYCRKFKEEQGIPTALTGNGVTSTVLVFVVVFLVLINVGIIYLYRRCQNREIKQNMQMQVNSAVSQYFALSTRNTSSGSMA